MRNNERVTASELVNAGVLTRTKAGRVELAPAVTYSLELENEPGADFGPIPLLTAHHDKNPTS